MAEKEGVKASEILAQLAALNDRVESLERFRSGDEPRYPAKPEAPVEDEAQPV